MSRARRSHGNSRHTSAKEVTFSHCIGYSLTVQNTFFFWIFDLNGGTGINRTENGNIRASSLIAFDKLKKRGQKGAIYVCEKDRARAQELSYRLGASKFDLEGLQDIYSRVWVENNRRFVQRIPDLISEQDENPRYAKGLITIDPDGMEVPHKEIEETLRQCPYFDILIHVSGMERVFGYRANDPENRRATKSFESIDDLLRLKPYSLISERDVVAGFGHYILFLSNTPLRSYEVLGGLKLYATTSFEGRAEIDRLNSYLEKR